MLDNSLWKINILTTIVILFILSFLIIGFTQMFGPIALIKEDISLNINHIPYYALRTSMRFLVAIFISIIVAIIYGITAAKNLRIRRVIIPLLDIFQSVPILGYLSFTIAGFVALTPGNIFGIELAIIFAIFSSQVWNIIFSTYQSFTTIPLEAYEVSRIYKLNNWQIFWRLELPFAIPGIIWNLVLSISNSWFFIVLAEAISIGNEVYNLPGLGSYIALAIKNTDYNAIFEAIIGISAVILIFNSLFFSPLVVWSQQFRYEFNTKTTNPSSFVYDLFKQSSITKLLEYPCKYFIKIFLNLSLPKIITKHVKKLAYIIELFFWIGSIYFTIHICNLLYDLCYKYISLSDVKYVIELGSITALRVLVMLLLASIIWVPIGVMISSRPVLSSKIQPLIQFITSIPANIYFPIFVIMITDFHFNPEITLSFMMIMGAQWYILYNVIAGGESIPTELLEAAENFKIKGLQKWKKIILPAIFPFYITGMITASGAAWNASIVGEIITWGSQTVSTKGIGSYIAISTSNGDFARIALGIIIMSCYVVAINNILWAPLYEYASKKFRLD